MAPPLPCVDGVSNLVITRWAPEWRASGFPSRRRGVRTTLVNGVRSLNEVETFPRHHEQRRAIPVYQGEPRIVKRNLPDETIRHVPGGATESRSLLSAPSRAPVSLSARACASRSRNSSSVMYSAASASSLAGSCDGLGPWISRTRCSTWAASSRTYSAGASLRIVYFWPRISTSTRFFSAMGAPSPAFGSEIELVQLLENAVDLRQDFLALVSQGLQLPPLPFQGREPRLHSVALFSQEGNCLGGSADRLLQLRNPLGQILAHRLRLLTCS